MAQLVGVYFSRSKGHRFDSHWRHITQVEGSIPGQGVCEKAASGCFSLTFSYSLSLFLYPPPSFLFSLSPSLPISLKAMKKCPWLRIKKNIFQFINVGYICSYLGILKFLLTMLCSFQWISFTFLIKFIPWYFFLNSVVNGIVFLISFSDCLLLL